MSTDPEKVQQSFVQRAKAWGGKLILILRVPAHSSRIPAKPPHRIISSSITTSNIHFRTTCSSLPDSTHALSTTATVLNIPQSTGLQD